MNKERLTSVVALNDFMSKRRGVAIYEFLNKFGKSHTPWYRYRCFAMGDEVIGTGINKRDAKQVVARMMLEQLSLRGYKVPAEFASPHAINKLMDLAGVPTHSYVVLLNELCQEYRLDPVQYEVLADPAGLQGFTVKARIGYVERVATASSKRIAQQLAAEYMYTHLRTRLSGTMEFNEEEAMISAYRRTLAQISAEQVASSLREQQRRQEEEQAAAARRQSQADKEKKQSLAAQATERMELDQSEHSVQTSYEVGPALPPAGPPPAPQQDGNNAQAADDDAVHQVAVQLLQLTMERLGL